MNGKPNQYRWAHQSRFARWTLSRQGAAYEWAEEGGGFTWADGPASVLRRVLLIGAPSRSRAVSPREPTFKPRERSSLAGHGTLYTAGLMAGPSNRAFTHKMQPGPASFFVAV